VNVLPENNDICEVRVIHPEEVEEARKTLPEGEVSARMAELFKAMGDRNRLRILLCLGRGEMCVCDLSATLELSESLVSHQLRVLRNLHLVRFRKEGKMVFYSLDDQHVELLLKQGLDHVREEIGLD
jgi:DNA-binding transcriptional ArsR family regulator